MTTRKDASSAKVLDWEVLPPEAKQTRSQLEKIFGWLALVMDNLLRLPGTKFRIGLDPIIGLFPGIGDTASAIVSALALIYATRCGLPKIVLARMALNVLINELVGIIPGIGDAFSFWFKANARNYQLLQRFMVEPRQTQRSDWIFVVSVLLLLFLIVSAGLAVSLFLFEQIVQRLGGW